MNCLEVKAAIRQSIDDNRLPKYAINIVHHLDRYEGWFYASGDKLLFSNDIHLPPSLFTIIMTKIGVPGILISRRIAHPLTRHTINNPVDLR